MANLPFDNANFNLTNFANIYPDIMDSTPKTIEYQYKDTNGNIQTKTIANRGMFKQQLWDDVGGALGQFNRVFYVDGENGDDNNDGSSSAPFKTIKKAVDSIPISGQAVIYLGNNAANIIDSYVDILNKNLVFKRWNKSGTGDNSTIKFKWYISDDKNNLYSFYAYRTRSSGNINLGFWYVNLEEDTTDFDSNKDINSKYMFKTGYDGTAICRNITFYRSVITLTNAICVSSLYETGLSYYFASGGILSVTVNNSTINTNGNYFMQINKSSGILNAYNIDIDDSSYWCSGIVKDADSGNPINLLSNINFSD